ncbi:MAG: hypothetical protein DME24_10990 [Verrucomicrobia bacterium]|nr:MAG: hypothetical protein DME24_10990 [Verrucomicrobiota bacterium]
MKSVADDAWQANQMLAFIFRIDFGAPALREENHIAIVKAVKIEQKIMGKSRTLKPPPAHENSSSLLLSRAGLYAEGMR